MRLFLATLVLAACLQQHANAEQMQDAMGWLKKMSTASQELNYSGVFIYQRGNHTEVSKISHFVDGKNVYEKLQALDGPPREIIRTNDEVQCFFPQYKMIRIERRSSQRFFPFGLPQQLEKLTAHYNVDKAEQERISGFLSQAFVVTPRDALRYGHKYWADISSGLLLKAKKLGENNSVLEQYTFTDLEVDAKLDRNAFKPSYDAQGWKRDQSGSSDISGGNTQWKVENIPAGFEVIKEMERRVNGKPGLITHIVLSDGLAAVSVFIEMLGAGNVAPEQGLNQDGPINVYTKVKGDHLITVIGEVPGVTATMIGDSVNFKGK